MEKHYHPLRDLVYRTIFRKMRFKKDNNFFKKKKREAM